MSTYPAYGPVDTMSSEAETTSAVTTPVTPTKAGAPGSAHSTPSKETDEAMNQLVQGKRHLLVRDFALAVDCLSKACELLVERFGQMAPECGDAFFNYGKALLEQARTESDVVERNESEKGDDDEEEDEEGSDEEQEEDAEEKAEGKEVDDDKSNAEGASEDTKDDDKTTDKKEKNGTAEELNGNAAHSAEGDQDSKENGAKAGDETDKQEDEEAVTSLQLAWEWLEMAKAILEKQLSTADDKQTALKLSEVYLKLGEVGIESETYDTAIEDMKSCLDLQKKYLDEDDRRIAETLYTMGVSYSLSNEFELAIKQFQAASQQIEKRVRRLEELKTKGEPVEKDEGKDAFYTIQGELDELKALLPDVRERINDMKDFKNETVRRMMEKIAEDSSKQSSTADGAGPSSTEGKPVSSVAHLVKRKPKEEVVLKAEGAVSTAEKKEDSSAKKESSNTLNTDKAQNSQKEESKDAEEAKIPKNCELSDKKRKQEDSAAQLSPDQKKTKLEEN